MRSYCKKSNQLRPGIQGQLKAGSSIGIPRFLNPYDHNKVNLSQKTQVSFFFNQNVLIFSVDVINKSHFHLPF